MTYYSLFEKLIAQMTSLEEFDIPGIFSTLASLCQMLHVSKGVTTYYENHLHEIMGDGESFVCYDTGEEHVLVSSLRKELPSGLVVVCNVYKASEEPDFSEENQNRIHIIQHIMVTCLNWSRQRRVVNKLAYQDDDGYYNLRYYMRNISSMLGQGTLAGKTAVRFNLSHFSLVNERIGKKAGDVIMRNYCTAFQSAAGEHAILCRLGGDNFLGLFDSARLQEVITFLSEAPIDFRSNQHVTISATAGLYTINTNEEIKSPGDVMERLITPFMIARRQDKNSLQFYSETMQLQAKKVRKILHKFRTGLEKEEFLVYYQPKVDIATKKLIGAEALCRWKRKGKIVPPLDFIPILERGYDICQLDFYMLDHVCKDIRRWLDEGKPVVPVSVNLSRRHMVDTKLFTHIVEIIDRNNVPHEYIEIELTETTTDVEFSSLKKIVSELQQSGISASVDDFGIGYSSLNLIKEIPWDILKLDKSILPDRQGDLEKGTRMFAHVIAMAHELGLKCVAEGVETSEQLSIMQHYGCRIAQGFLFDYPLPVEEFEKRMDNGKYE